MKLAVISDIHSNIFAFKEVLKKILEMVVDEIWCCGDIIGYYPFPNECIDLIKKHKIQSVLGNHDWATITGDTTGFGFYGREGVKINKSKITKDNVRFLKDLPKNLMFVRDNISFYITHGSPRDNLFEYIFEYTSNDVFNKIVKDIKSDIILLGHTHVFMEKNVGDKKFLNPGSVGQPRDSNPDASFLIFNTGNMKCECYRVSYDIDAMTDAIKKNGLSIYLAKRLYSGD